MRQYEYKQLSAKPLIVISSPKEFSEWMVKTMNTWGSEGWLLLQISTPMVGNQLTGEMLALGCRELPIDPDVKALLEKKAAAKRFPPPPAP